MADIATINLLNGVPVGPAGASTVPSLLAVKNNLDILVGAVTPFGQTSMAGSLPMAPANDSPGIAFLPKNLAAMTSATSNNMANTDATAVLGGTGGKTTFLTGFTATASGSTAGKAVVVTITGAPGSGALLYVFTFPVGILVGAVPLNVQFNPPLQTSVGGAFILLLPAGGAGNTNACISCSGFVQ